MDGSMRIDGGFEKIGLENRKRLFERYKINNLRNIKIKQCHGINVVVLDRYIEDKIECADGIITSEKEVILSVTVGDCLPVYFYDPAKEIIGIAHAGWKGVIDNISKNMISKMIESFGSNPQDIVVNIGPHIRDCHFEVKSDLVDIFKKYKEQIIKKDEKFYINLGKVVERQLVESGVKFQNIIFSEKCTHCDKSLFSFRRDKPKDVEVMLAFIAKI